MGYDGLSESDARTWAMFTHLASFSGFVIPPIGSIVGPLVVWLIKKDESDFVDRHGKSAVNFQISMLIWILLCIPLCFVIVGFVLIPVLAILGLVYTIVNMIRASNGDEPGYPISIRFVG